MKKFLKLSILIAYLTFVIFPTNLVYADTDTSIKVIGNLSENSDTELVEEPNNEVELVEKETIIKDNDSLPKTGEIRDLKLFMIGLIITLGVIFKSIYIRKEKG